MPNFNGTGPQGQGPLTGRGLGPCGGGMGSRRGGGRGFRRMPAAGYQRPQEVLDEKETLAQEEKYLKEELEAVKKAQADLKK